MFFCDQAAEWPGCYRPSWQSQRLVHMRWIPLAKDSQTTPDGLHSDSEDDSTRPSQPSGWDDRYTLPSGPAGSRLPRWAMQAPGFCTDRQDVHGCPGPVGTPVVSHDRRRPPCIEMAIATGVQTRWSATSARSDPATMPASD
jgi:hypothetical protein